MAKLVAQDWVFYAMTLGADSSDYAVIVGIRNDSSNPAFNLTQVGHFIDGPVEGLRYTCKKAGVDGYAGITDKDGMFNCARDDDKIVFKVGNITLPEVPIKLVIYPKSFFSPDTEIDAPEVLQLVRFIMSTGTVVGGNIKIVGTPFGGKSGVYSGALFNELASQITFTEDEAKGHLKTSLMQAHSGYYLLQN